MHIFLLGQKENKHWSVPNHPEKGNPERDFQSSAFPLGASLSLNTFKIQAMKSLGEKVCLVHRRDALGGAITGWSIPPIPFPCLR